jgi:hypothetical protein
MFLRGHKLQIGHLARLKVQTAEAWPDTTIGKRGLTPYSGT